MHTVSYADIVTRTVLCNSIAIPKCFSQLNSRELQKRKWHALFISFWSSDCEIGFRMAISVRANDFYLSWPIHQHSHPLQQTAHHTANWLASFLRNGFCLWQGKDKHEEKKIYKQPNVSNEMITNLTRTHNTLHFKTRKHIVQLSKHLIRAINYQAKEISHMLQYGPCHSHRYNIYGRRDIGHRFSREFHSRSLFSVLSVFGTFNCDCLFVRTFVRLVLFNHHWPSTIRVNFDCFVNWSEVVIHSIHRKNRTVLS